MLNIASIVASLIGGLAKLAGFFTAFLYGKNREQLKQEKATRKRVEEDAKRWKNRPRNKSDLLKRMRERKDK